MISYLYSILLSCVVVYLFYLANFKCFAFLSWQIVPTLQMREWTHSAPHPGPCDGTWLLGYGETPTQICLTPKLVSQSDLAPLEDIPSFFLEVALRPDKF